MLCKRRTAYRQVLTLSLFVAWQLICDLRCNIIEKTIRKTKSPYYPAYITIDGFGNTYEYALIREEKQEIVYLYLAYPDNSILSEYGDYVKKDKTVYDKADTAAFSLYNHSFDGGKSWVEFDD